MTTIFIDDEPHYWADGPPGAFVPLAEADALEAQIAALTTERDSLRALVERLVERGPGIEWTLDYHNDIGLADELGQLIEDCKAALNKPTNQPTTTGEPK